jgi:hypothetical protein
MGVLEQITYLLFMRRLDEMQQGMENRGVTFEGAHHEAGVPGRA